MSRSGRPGTAARLGGSGALLGVVAGIVQVAWGSEIPAWTGAKQSPTALGLLTIALSVLAGAAAVRQGSRRLTTGGRTACAGVLLGTGLLCFSTVGRLWYLPGALLVLAGLTTIDRWRDTASGIGRDWSRCLLSALGITELLMVAGTTTATAVVGAVGGVTLMVAPWWRTAPRPVLLTLVLLGTLPFAALAWTAIIPILLPLAAVAPTLALLLPRPAGVRLSATGRPHQPAATGA